jgi:dUTP pyrophosphatase
MHMIIPFKGPFAPMRAKEGDAGFDIACSEDTLIYAKTSASVSTGLQLAIPEGYVGRVVSRSGLSFKFSVEVGAGVIDSGYRGEIKVKLHNFGDTPVRLYKGDRIAQIIIQKHESPVFVPVDALTDTERGAGGFGHTGMTQEVHHVSV